MEGGLLVQFFYLDFSIALPPLEIFLPTPLHTGLFSTQLAYRY